MDQTGTRSWIRSTPMSSRCVHYYVKVCLYVYTGFGSELLLRDEVEAMFACIVVFLFFFSFARML